MIMDKQAEQPAPSSVYGKELLQSALLGSSVTAAGASLYHLLAGLPATTVPELLRDETPVVKPKPATAKKKKPALKFATDWQASAAQLADRIFTQIGDTAYLKNFPSINFAAKSTSLPSPDAWHEGYRNAANLAAAAAGGYGGLKLVSTSAEQKKKEDLAHEVDSARKEYFEALTGKQAEILDAAYTALEKTGTLGGAAITTALLTALGSGAIGATYMYNQTRSRSRAENVQRAAAARARLRGLQQTPWVDPEQLASLTKNK